MSETIYSDQIKVNCPLIQDENGYFHLVYQITNLVNGKVYVGKHSTKELYDGYMGSGTNIMRAIEKYGIENFTKEILYCFTDENEAFLKEAEIVNLDFVKNENTYNIAVGGNGHGGSWRGEKHPFYGKHLSQEHKDKISKANIGRKHTEESKELMRKNHADFSGENHPLYGKHHSQETKDKIAKTNKEKFSGEKNPMYGKHHSQETKDKIAKTKKGKNLKIYQKLKREND